MQGGRHAVIDQSPCRRGCVGCWRAAPAQDSAARRSRQGLLRPRRRHGRRCADRCQAAGRSVDPSSPTRRSRTRRSMPGRGRFRKHAEKVTGKKVVFFPARRTRPRRGLCGPAACTSPASTPVQPDRGELRRLRAVRHHGTQNASSGTRWRCRPTAHQDAADLKARSSPSRRRPRTWLGAAVRHPQGGFRSRGRATSHRSFPARITR